MSDTILTAENLKFRYDAEQPVYALDGVSVQVKRGEFVAVLGANGCGKSTLAKHFNAILLPESGKVYVEGMDTADEEKLYDIRQTVGMVFQNPDNQIVATVVEEDVAFALENLGVPQDEMRRRVDDSMKMAGIYEYRERAPHNLSGGQKQRVAIAGVVAMRPDCLILDDAAAAPTAGQEVTVRASMVCVKTPMSDDVPAELRTALKAGADGSRRAPGEGRCYRRNPVPVPEADREAWAMARLERLGLSVTSCSMEASSEVRAPKGRSPWPVITVKATVTVRETETFANAWLTGTGKGKAYGFGMLIVK